MEKRTENQAEEALRYVYECLCGHIKKPDEKDVCALIVPDDIADSFVKRDYFYYEDHPFNRTSIYLGEILWIWAYHENGAGTKTSDLQNNLDAVISEYYMLKPSAVTLEKTLTENMHI